MAQPKTFSDPTTRELLSPRLYQAARLVMAGLPDREIARLMGITHNMAKLYVHRCFERTETASRLELANRLAWEAVEQGTP